MKESDSDEFSNRIDDLGVVRYQKSNHAGHRRVKNHDVAKKFSKVTVNKTYIDEMLTDHKRLHKEKDKIDGSKKGFRDTYRAGRKVIRSEPEDSEDDSTRDTQKEHVVSKWKKDDERRDSLSTEQNEQSDDLIEIIRAEVQRAVQKHNVNQTAQSQAEKRVIKQTENVQGICDLQEGQLDQKKIST